MNIFVATLRKIKQIANKDKETALCPQNAASDQFSSQMIRSAQFISELTRNSATEAFVMKNILRHRVQ